MIKNTRARVAVLGAAMTAVLALGVAAAAPASAATAPNSKTAASQYDLSIGGKSADLSEGQTLAFPMVPVQPNSASGHVHTDVAYPGNGWGTLYVTASGGVFHYHVDMNVPATNFVGHFLVFDITAGRSGGRTLELVFAGDVPTSKARGHKYSGSLDGEADFAGIPVATVGPNYTTYTYNP